ncbi:magnesium/cobalt transporter CorA [Streptomyces sp. LBUM 1478]|uniref:Magnesium transport protein CorA n=1 Tax=Streptomyces scabiei (strain 87.22) TaxID=680198 RepID=C9Z2Y9_STRSW|nr:MULTISPECIES: magnesium/cobalt transporter CorA [Streptomyces]MBP5866390.1 magnesium/cobalt transporter CorA [Streptomyces sp. LBUM 1485]MBP5905091.1 magnesium/cobalt transporter CorA [Streptomyces sp. LBUM 1478]MBP5932633.1 magnesium/cobalt transporter CorA [Streptomyces sp. LBUM 1479]MBP5917918.1 magnesium/cobalt transporter CorA [Streptomyces sp. LBUM 1486]MDX2535406.1 magnesium/cobalt transporter CorA [Streptomyces scabiei]
MIVDCAVYRDGHRAEGPEDLSDALAAARASGGFVWIGLHEPSEKEFALVTEEFALHPLAVEDALKAHQRPKLEVYDDSLFMVLKPVGYEPSTDAVTTGEVMVFLGDAFVVTVRHGEGSPLGVVRRRLEQEPELLGKGPTSVLYAITDATVDHYLDVATELQTDLEELEAEVFSPDVGGSRNTASRIYTFKRQVLEFRRATGPLAAPLNRLSSTGNAAAVPFVDEKAQPFFRDVNDHLTRVNESVEGLDRLVSDILSAHLAQMSVRQNDDMRKISAWAAMAAIPTMAAGVYGMNFEHMPELHWGWSYPALMALMVVAEVLVFRLFKRRGWL